MVAIDYVGKNWSCRSPKGEEHMRFWLYVIKAVWRFQMGRWYVWRDVPTDVVRRVAVLWYFDRKEEKNKLVYEAYKEYQLRKLKEKNT